ncbi:MAG: FHA domain-containing protein [Bacillota bacterium]|nr:FHA domain-containing protein [Bacillota bacterium]
MIPHELIREKGPYGSILVGCPAEAEHLITYQLQFLMHHRPDWLIPCYVRYRSGKPQVCLDISDLQPLDEAFAEQARTQDAGRLLLSDICILLMTGNDLLLPLSQFSLHPSLIYLDRSRSVRLAFWPYRDLDDGRSPAAEDLPELVKVIGGAFNWPDEQIDAAAGACQNGLLELTEHLAGPENPARSLDEPAGCPEPQQAEHGSKAISGTDSAEKTRKSGKKPGRQANPTAKKDKRNPLTVLYVALHIIIIAWSCATLLGRWPVSRDFIFPVLSVLALADLILFCRSRRQNRPDAQPAESGRLWDKLVHAADMGSDAAAVDDDQTVLLSPSESDFRMAMLCEGQPGSAAEHEGIRAFILVDEFIIGRDPKKADLCLPDQAIGRTHARIVRRAGSFFICDLGSGNGTHIDGKRLQKHVESLLPDRCLLQIADRSFYFQAD